MKEQYKTDVYWILIALGFFITFKVVEWRILKYNGAFLLPLFFILILVVLLIHRLTKFVNIVKLTIGFMLASFLICMLYSLSSFTDFQSFKETETTIAIFNSEYNIDSRYLTMELTNLGKANIIIDSNTSWLLKYGKGSDTWTDSKKICEGRWDGYNKNVLCVNGCDSELKAGEKREIVLALNNTNCDIFDYPKNTYISAKINFENDSTFAVFEINDVN